MGEDLTEDGAGLTAGTSGQLVSDSLDFATSPSLCCAVQRLLEQ